MAHPLLAVDGVLIESGKLLVVVRGRPPFEGMHALPGGHVELGESTEAAMVREMEEETSLRVEIAGIVGVYSDPTRDPRGHTVSVAYLLRRSGGEPKAGSDARRLAWLDAQDPGRLAFDHNAIVADHLRGGQRFR